MCLLHFLFLLNYFVHLKSPVDLNEVTNLSLRTLDKRNAFMRTKTLYDVILKVLVGDFPLCDSSLTTIYTSTLKSSHLNFLRAGVVCNTWHLKLGYFDLAFVSIEIICLIGDWVVLMLEFLFRYCGFDCVLFVV